MNKLGMVVLALILVLPLSYGATIDDVSFTFTNNTITTVGPSNSLPVLMTVIGQKESDSFKLFADLQQVNRESFQKPDYLNKPFSCSTEQTTFNCSANIELWPKEENPSINFTIVENDIESSATYKTDLRIDSTRPRVTDITTPYIYNDQYVMRDNSVTEFTIELEDNVASFNILDNIWYAVGQNSKDRAGQCDGMTCKGLTARSCESGFTTSVEVVSPSSDDAGNAVRPAKDSTFVICDSTKPEMISDDVSISIDAEEYFTTPKAGDSIEVSALFTDDATGIEASAKFTSMIASNESIKATCTQVNEKERMFNCTWQLTNIIPGNHDIIITAKDHANRSAEVFNTQLEVQEYDRARQKTPLFFKPVIAKPPATEGYNRIPIDLAMDVGQTYPLFATFKLERSNVGNDVTALYTTVDPYECTITNNNGQEFSARKFFSEITIAQPESNHDVPNRLDFELTAISVNAIPNTLNMYCNVSTIVNADGVIYERPTHTLVMTTLRFKNTALNSEHIGSRFAEEIQDREKRINGTLPKAIGFLNRAAATMSTVCDLNTALDSVGMTGATMQAVSVVLRNIPVLTGVGEGLLQSGKQTQQTSDNLVNPILSEEDKKGIQKLIGDACRWVTCSADKNKENYPDWYFGGNTPLNDIGFSSESPASGGQGIVNDLSDDLTGDLNVPNPKDSIISSVMAQCIPGMLYHVNRYRESNCNTLLCVKQMSRLGMDPTVCKQAQAQFVCQEIIGEAFEAVPVAREATNLVENVQGLAKTILPTSLKYVTNNLICQDVNPDAVEKGADTTTWENIKIFACSLPKAVGKIANTNLNKNGNAGNFQYPNTFDVCKQALCNDPNTCDVGKASFTDSLAKNPVEGNAQTAMQLDDDSSYDGTNTILEEAESDVKQNQEYLSNLKVKLKENEKDVDSLNNRIRELEEELDADFPIDHTLNTENDFNTIDSPKEKIREEIADLEEQRTNANTKVRDTLTKISERKDLLKNYNNRVKTLESMTPEERTNTYDKALKDYDKYLEKLKEKEERVNDERGEETDAVNSIDVETDQQIASGTLQNELQTKEPADDFLEEKELDPELWTIKQDRNGNKVIKQTKEGLSKEAEWQTSINEYKDLNDFVNEYDDLDDFVNKAREEIRNVDDKVYRTDRILTWIDVGEHEKTRKLLKEGLYRDRIRNANLVSKITISDGNLQVDPEIKKSADEAQSKKDQLAIEKDKAARLQVPIDVAPKEITIPSISGQRSIKIEEYVDDVENPQEPSAERQEEKNTLEQRLAQQGFTEKEIERVKNLKKRIQTEEKLLLDREKVRISNAMSKNEVELKKLENCDDCSDEEINNLEDKNEKLGNHLKKLEKEGYQLTKDQKDKARATAIQKTNEQREINRQKIASIEKVANTAANILWNQGLLDWMITTNWGSDGSSYNQFVDTTIDTDAWKAGICGPLVRTPKASTGDEGDVIQCQGSTCTPVLSQAAEKVNTSDGHLYTVVIAVGPYSGQDSYEYAVFMKEANGNKRKLFQNDLEVPAGQPQTKSVLFPSKRLYEQVCVQFLTGTYPPGEIGAKNEYCRPVVDANAGLSAFDTGVPVNPSAPSASSPTNLNNAGISNDI